MPLYMFSVTLQNAFKPCCQPRLVSLQIRHAETEAKPQDRIRWKIIPVEKADTSAQQRTLNASPLQQSPSFRALGTLPPSPNPDGFSYIVLVEIEHLKPPYIVYSIEHLNGVSDTRSFQGRFQAPLHALIPPYSNGIFYLGHVSQTVRERSGNEFRAGPLEPRVDQFLSGFSDGTFDVEIEDLYDDDIAALHTLEPIFSTLAIQPRILLPFDRKQAQHRWEENTSTSPARH